MSLTITMNSPAQYPALYETSARMRLGAVVPSLAPRCIRPLKASVNGFGGRFQEVSVIGSSSAAS
jgi:hypothetical protein